MVNRATVSTVFHLVTLLRLQVIGVKRGPRFGLRSEHAGRNRIGRGQDVELQQAGYLREQDPDSARRQSLLQKSRVRDTTAPATGGSVRADEVHGVACNNVEDCGRADGFVGCCYGASPTSTTTSTTLSATTGAHTSPRTTTTTTTTTTVAATTSTTTPSPLDLDLCFVIDTTGSMGPYIEAFKSQATSIADDIVTRVRASPKYNGHDDHLPKFAVVPFTDVGQPGHLARSTIIDFIQDKDHFSNSVRPLVATSGGRDWPEDALGALDYASKKLSWNAQIRFLVLVTDAPAHGNEFHGPELGDRFPGGYPPGVTMENVMKRLQDKRIELVFCRVNEVVTRQMETVMRDKYDSTERKMTSFSLSVAGGFGPQVTDKVVKMLIEDHM